MLLSNINQGKFEMKRGNTIASFAQAVNMNFNLYFNNSEDIVFDNYRNEKMHSYDLHTSQQGTILSVLHHRLLKSGNNFVPYLQEYFLKYKSSQKLVILRMLQLISIHDDSLYSNFTNEVIQILSKYSGEELTNKMKQICITQHPLTNESIDRTFEMLEVLDFHYGISER